MLNDLKQGLPANFAIGAAAFPVSVDEDSASRTLSSYLRYTPILWVLGLLSPLGVLLILRLFFRKASYLRPCSVTWLWWVVGFMQAVCVLVNGLSKDVSLGSILYRLVSAPVTGWLLLGLAVAVGCRYRLNSPRLVRGVCILGTYMLVLGSGTLALAFVTGAVDLSVKSPIGMLLPANLPSIQTAFTMRFFMMDEVLGSSLPRLILFYPWSACLGFAGIAVFFIALQELRFFLKATGALGGLLAVAGSMSRAAAVALLVSGAVYLFRRMRPGHQHVALAAASAIGIGLIVFNLLPMDIVSKLNNSITEMREGSTEARQMGYDESWRGFLQSPIFGQGWPGEVLSDEIPMPVGTHSTIYGVLYTGGLLTFIPFCLAMGWTLILLLRESSDRTGEHCSALAIAVTVAILCYGEGIYSFPLPTLFAFCWLGAALTPPRFETVANDTPQRDCRLVWK